jgi:hypothetical protein
MKSKHEDLPTDILFLFSRNGFTEAVDSEKGIVKILIVLHKASAGWLVDASRLRPEDSKRAAGHLSLNLSGIGHQRFSSGCFIRFLTPCWSLSVR